MVMWTVKSFPPSTPGIRSAKVSEFIVCLITTFVRLLFTTFRARAVVMNDGTNMVAQHTDNTYDTSDLRPSIGFGLFLLCI